MSDCAALSISGKVTKGKISLLEEGKEFCLKQIAAGLNAFSSVLSNELPSFKELAVNSEDDGSEQEEEDDVEDVSEGEEDEGDEDDLGDLQEEQVAGAIRADDELTEFTDELQPFPPLRSELIGENIYVWRFPQDISQSTFNKRNGSNACSFISILLACLFKRKNMQIPGEGFLPSNVLRILCGCIEIGNRMYDNCRDSLPSRYLSVQEAATLVSFSNVHVSVAEPLPVRLEDVHELSTLCGQLRKLTDDKTYYLNIVINEKTSLFVLTPPNIMYIDTHLHGSSGAVIVKGFTLNLSDFCKFVWALEEHDQSTFGNLSALTFP